MFESICISIRTTCKANREAVGNFEQGLFPTFEDILQQDVQGLLFVLNGFDLFFRFNISVYLIQFLCVLTEFIPYVFQILSLLLEMQSSTVPEKYMQLFPHLLLPSLWERPGNIPPLVRLLQAFIEKGANQIGSERIVSTVKLNLISSRSRIDTSFMSQIACIFHLRIYSKWHNIHFH